jgi:hypothetical protein
VFNAIRVPGVGRKQVQIREDDEVLIGVLDPAWRRRYSLARTVRNQRLVTTTASFCDWQERGGSR